MCAGNELKLYILRLVVSMLFMNFEAYIHTQPTSMYNVFEVTFMKNFPKTINEIVIPLRRYHSGYVPTTCSYTNNTEDLIKSRYGIIL